MDPVGRGGTQRLHAGLESEGAFGRCQEVGEIAPGRNQGRQEPSFTIQPSAGFGAPIAVDRLALFVPQPVQTQYGFPEHVRVSGQAQPGQIESREMDTQHQTPT
ncbi:hypothetical protein GCM10020221_18550 [Streptomyces thioluteus]|uniref:Uncharacterized protein n=1 Tax=Streptomyces thioluteus TaxID=66431 RepID=A0ABN3WNH6_STRTU